MNLTEHFTLEELIHSTTAQKYSIDNRPNKYIISNLTSICKYVMEPIRQRYEKPIIVTSGYRCPRLNALVKGASTSQHIAGTAIDFRPKEAKDIQLLWNIIVDMLEKGEIECRQLIDEYNLSWIHISINDKHHGYRKNQILHIK